MRFFIASEDLTTLRRFFTLVYYFKPPFNYKIVLGLGSQEKLIDRPLNTIYMEESIKKVVIDYLDDFLKPETKTWYKSKGKSYKCTFLLHGPAGNGKTSFIKAIAHKYNMNLYVLNPGIVKTEMSLHYLASSIKAPAILAIEDIHTIFAPHRQTELASVYQGGPGSITFAGLLGFLDGIHSTEGLVTFMSANDVTGINPIALRAGRVNLTIRFENPNQMIINAMVTEFRNEEDARVLSRHFEKMSGAQIEEILTQCRRDTTDVLLKKLPQIKQCMHDETARSQTQYA